MTDHSITSRFAPSPTGLLHVGNARTALFNHLFARSQQGWFLLRIEDTDAARSRPEYVQALLEDLRWLGLDWDGALQLDELCRQSQRGEIYARYFDALEQAGLGYPCFCTPAELAMQRKRQLARGEPPRYDGRCAQLSSAEVQVRQEQGLTSTLRFRVPAGRTVLVDDLIRGEQRFESDQIGDFIIRRGDGTPAFFFCNAVDDASMGVTHVLRGEDHMANTPRQLLLLEALNLPPPRYGHMPLIVGEDGAPLSKRHGSFALADLRAAGYLPRAILNYLARLGHHYETDLLLDPAGLSGGFRLSAIGRAPARFEVAQLRHWQKLAVMGLSTSQFLDWLGEGLMQRIPEPAREAFVAIVRPNVILPADAAHWVRIVYEEPAVASPALEDAVKKAGAAFFTSAWQAYVDADHGAASFIERLKELTGARGKALFEPLRMALTGEAHGPELRDLLQLIPPESVQARLHKCAELAAH